MNVLYIEAFSIKLAGAVALFFLAVLFIQQRQYPWNIIVPLLWVLLMAGWAVYGCTAQQRVSFILMKSLATSDKRFYVYLSDFRACRHAPARQRRRMLTERYPGGREWRKERLSYWAFRRGNT